MTPQERQQVEALFDRLSQVENAPRDKDAEAAIARGLSVAPNAVYALVQTTLIQDEALARANQRIEELERAQGAGQGAAQSGSFLDSMRDTFFGRSPARGSVPSVPQGGYQGGYGSQQQMPPQAPWNAQPQQSSGGSFLGTAAAAAAGVIGGSLLLGSIRSMMGGGMQGGHSAFDGGFGRDNGGPWIDNSSSELSREAGINDIGNSNASRSSFFGGSDEHHTGDNDFASHDSHDHDTSDFGDFDIGGDSDYG